MRKVRRRVNKFKIFRFIIIVFLVVVVVILGISKFKVSSSEREKDNNRNKEIVTEKEELDKKASMVMVGDNLIHESIYEEAYNNGSYDFGSMYELMKPIISQYDIAYYNQETILGGSEIGVSSYPAFNSPYEVGDAMVDCGFNLVSLATNHTLDRGEKAVLNSRNYWDSKTDVLAGGSYASLDKRNEVQVREVNGISYTMLNYTYGTNGISVPSGKEYLVNIWPMASDNPDNDIDYQKYKEKIKIDIERVRNNVDVLFVAMHWGVEYQTSPNQYQIDAANYLASLGVDIIIGTHAHVIQPVTWIGDTLVIYSLGNFLSAHEVINMGNRIGLMTSVDIIKDSETNEITINDVENELLYTYYTKDYHDFRIVPFSQMNSNFLSNYREVYDKYKSIVTSLDSDMNVIPLE